MMECFDVVLKQLNSIKKEMISLKEINTKLLDESNNLKKRIQQLESDVPFSKNFSPIKKAKKETFESNRKIKFHEVVKGKKERDKLNGYTCRECVQYYATDKINKEDLDKKLKLCSKHRHKYTPPPVTPDSFWRVSFPSSQEIIDKGYMLTENDSLPEHAKPFHIRQREKGIIRRQKYF